MVNKLFLLVISILSSFLRVQSMEQRPTGWHDLPKELKSYIVSLTVEKPTIKNLLEKFKKLGLVNKEFSQISKELIYNPEAFEKLTGKECKLEKQFIAGSRNGNIELITILLNLGVDVNTKDYYLDNTALMYSTQRGYNKIVRLLLDRDADVNAQTYNTNWTPLIVAVATDNIEVIKMLLEKGADVNAQDNQGLSVSVFVRSQLALQLLKEAGTE